MTDTSNDSKSVGAGAPATGESAWVAALMLAALLVGVAVLYVATFDQTQAWGGDFSQYIAQAACLSSGSFDEYRELATFRYENSTDRRLGPKYYPWGYPAILAPVYAAYGLDLFPMKVVTALFFLMALAVTGYVFGHRLSPYQRLFVVALIGLNPYFFEHRQHLASDVPFLFVSLLTIWAIQEAVIHRRRPWAGLVGSFTVGVLLFASCSIRASGIVLLPTLLAVQVVEFVRARQRGGGTVSDVGRAAIPYAVFFAFTGLATVSLPHESSYADQITLVTFGSLAHNAEYYALLPGVFFAVGSHAVGSVVYLLTLLCVGIGLWSRARQDYLYVTFATLTLALYVIWPSSRQGLRFLFPLIPYYLYFMVIGADRLSDAARPFTASRGWAKRGEVLAGAALLLLFAIGVGLNVAEHVRGAAPPPGAFQPDSIALFQFIREQTDEDATVSFFKPRVLTLYTGRRAADVTDWQNLKEHTIDLAVWNRDRAPPPELRDRRIVFQNDSFVCYRLDEEQ